MEMCWQTQNDGERLQARGCTSRFVLPGGSGYWSAVSGSRSDKHNNRIAWRLLVFRRYLRCWCYYLRRQMIVSVLTGVIKVLMLTTVKAGEVCVSSLKTIHLISCFLGFFLKFWFDFLLIPADPTGVLLSCISTSAAWPPRHFSLSTSIMLISREVGRWPRV